MSAQRSVVKSAKLIALCTLLSRITGLARDILIARAFGMDWVQDAFQYAFQFPNLFRRLLGEGAMAAAFVPTFTRALEKDGRDAAWGLLARSLALLTVAITALIIAIALLIALVWFLTPADYEQAPARELLLSLTALMLPFMLTICVLALFSSILNCVGSFVPAALAPVLLNVCVIVGVAVVAPALFPADEHSQVYVVALTVVVAGILQILAMLPVLRHHGVRLGWKLDTRDPHVRRMLQLLAPVLLGQGVLAFGVYLDAQICVLLTHQTDGPTTFTLLGETIRYPLEEGALSTVTYAQRLYQFPLGVLVISLATAALPTFSLLASREDWSAWATEVRQALRLAMFEGLLAGTMMVVLARSIFRFLFEYGDVAPADSARAAPVVMCYGFGLWAFCAQHLVLRAFYSIGDVRTPLKISAALLPLNVALNLVLIWFDSIREAAFAISTTTTMTLAVISGVWLLQRRVPADVAERRLAFAVGKMLCAAAASAIAVSYAAPFWSSFAQRIDVVVVARGVETLGLLALGTVIYLMVAILLRMDEWRLLWSGLTRNNAGKM